MLVLLACTAANSPSTVDRLDSAPDSREVAWGTVDVLVRNGPAMLRVHEPGGNLVIEREIDAGELTLDVAGGSAVSAALIGEATVQMDMVLDVQPGESLALLDAPVPTGPEIGVAVTSLPEGAARVRLAVLDCHAVAAKDLSSAPNSMSIRLYDQDCQGRPVAWVEDADDTALAFLVLEPATGEQLERDGITLDDWRTDWAWVDVAEVEHAHRVTLSSRDTDRRPIFEQAGPGRVKALPVGAEHVWLSALGELDGEDFQVVRQAATVPSAMALTVPEAFLRSIRADLTPGGVRGSWSQAPGQRTEVLLAYTIEHPEFRADAGLFWTVWPAAGATQTELPPVVYERTGVWGLVSVTAEDAETPPALRGRRPVEGAATWVESSVTAEE